MINFSVSNTKIIVIKKCLCTTTTLGLFESETYKTLPHKPKKSLENACNIYFENKGVKILNAALILRGRKMSTKFFYVKSFLKDLDFDRFLINPDSLPCKCNSPSFPDRYHKHITMGDLRIIKNT